MKKSLAIPATRQRRVLARSIEQGQNSSGARGIPGLRSSGELLVCIATSGPGASNLNTGLYDARLGRMPVLAMARTARDGHYETPALRPAAHCPPKADVKAAGAESGEGRVLYCKGLRGGRGGINPYAKSA